ncbi:ATP-grasp domain protein [uncultured archaeon]|nr:ATP-grasp domain protein [uncultured archaeon]
MNRVALLTETFLSETLLDTLQTLQVPTYAPDGLSARLSARGLAMISETTLKSKLADPGCVVYVNSEGVLPLVAAHHGNAAVGHAVRLFKDKVAFRRFLSKHYPDFFFREVPASQADLFRAPADRAFILKPAVGFFALGVRRFQGADEYRCAVRQALDEIAKHQGMMGKGVLDDSRFLIEEEIVGEEYACDAYYDAKGNAVVTGVYHRAFRDGNDARQLLYYTGASLVQKLLPQIQDFLSLFSKETGVVNFPVHVEFRATPDGKLVPIEVNPLRFGGFGLADVTMHAFGINPYQAFLEGQAPDWTEILSRPAIVDHAYHGFVLGQMDGITVPDVEKFKKTFRTLNGFVALDVKRFPVFCTAYPRTDDLNELYKYLHADFSQYNAAPTPVTPTLAAPTPALRETPVAMAVVC